MAGSPPKKSRLNSSLTEKSWSSAPVSRSSTPKAGAAAPGSESGDGPLRQQHGDDHTVTNIYRLDPSRYPKDCPQLNVRWFYAVDVPKRKPLAATPTKPQKPPSKFVAFSANDSRSIESAFQKLADEDSSSYNASKSTKQRPGTPSLDESQSSDIAGSLQPADKKTANENIEGESGGRVKVPVNEDYLFDVDVEQRELAPVYWLGPVYDVRRGTWFFQDGSNLKPCEENLATQLEEGYLKTRPWRYLKKEAEKSRSQPRSRPTSVRGDGSIESGNAESGSKTVSPKISSEDLRSQSVPPRPSSWFGSENDTPPKETESASLTAASAASKVNEILHDAYINSPAQQQQIQTHRLFGSYMNTLVTYQDSTVAWLQTDDFYSRMSSTLYQRVAGGGYLGGTKLIRGYSDTGKEKDKKTDSEKRPGSSNASDAKESGDENFEASAKKSSAGSSSARDLGRPEDEAKPEEEDTKPKNPREALAREMTSLVVTRSQDPEVEEEESRKRDEEEIQGDYKERGGEEQGREIDHLILVTHGIGQRLSLRLESVNFVHDVNVLRKTLKNVYSNSPDLQALNSEVDKLPKNCRVQVLPVCWRHKLDFPKQSLKKNREEHDIGDLDGYGQEEEYPSLEDITIEGVPAVRSLITDLALDVLLYQSAYREHISSIVLEECNRIYRIFAERNPNFNGKVSLIGHSLGSAILFDILCRQQDDHVRGRKHHQKYFHNRPNVAEQARSTKALALAFSVDSMFCIGSPVGLFQMLKGRTIAARSALDSESTGGPLDPGYIDDPLLASQAPYTVSSPKCAQLFNIFHPTDPISYRIEPLISSAMALLKPQPLPYTKRGIFTAPMGQGLSGIGAKVGQSVSGLWTSLSSGIASSILNRSLGFTGDEGKPAEGSAQLPSFAATTAPTRSAGAGTGITAGGVITEIDTSKGVVDSVEEHGGGKESEQEKIEKRKRLVEQQDENEPTTLIDTEIETLYDGFQRRRRASHEKEEGKAGVKEDSGNEAEADDRASRLKKEEAKVRALNSTGRVDFSIQEGVFDISLIASIASHLSYWSDEDVNHFVLSQLLSRTRSAKSKASNSGDIVGR